MLCGGRGDDVLTGGAGADLFAGGKGHDVVTDLAPSDGDETAGQRGPPPDKALRKPRRELMASLR